MSTINELTKLAVDAYHNNTQMYSVSESTEALRNALIEMNGGKTSLDYRAMRDHPEMFTLIENILKRTVVEGFTG